MILQKTTITDLHANLLRLYRHERENSIGSRENDKDGVDINDRQRSNSYISYQEARLNKTSSKPSTISLPIIISLSGRLSRSSSKCQNITSPDEQEDQNQDTHSGRRSNDEQQQLTGRLTKTARGLLQTKGYNIKFSPTNERSTKFEPKDENKRNPQGFFRKRNTRSPSLLRRINTLDESSAELERNTHTKQYLKNSERHFSMDERYSDGIRGSSPSGSEDSGGVSDETLDAIVEEERRDERCRTLSLSNPELASAQLKYLFPELSDYWRYW